MRKKLKKFVIIVVTMAMAAFLANLLVDNPYTHRMIRLAINKQVTDYTNLDA